MRFLLDRVVDVLGHLHVSFATAREHVVIGRRHFSQLVQVDEMMAYVAELPYHSAVLLVVKPVAEVESEELLPEFQLVSQPRP
jgi:hypothetical protein